jgi:hypothetical protein
MPSPSPLVRPLVPEPRRQSLQSGRTVTIHEGDEDRVVFSDPHGRFELGIRFTAAGPVLELNAIALSMRADAAIDISCDRLNVVARDRITLSSAGDLLERVAGDRRTEVAGALATEARSVELAAIDGSVEIAAADDTTIIGRRVLLNP